MYLEHFGLSGEPFKLTPDPRFFFGSRSHNKAMAYLHYGLRQGDGFIVITGEIGAGKSMLITHLLDQVDRTNVVAADLITPNLKSDELLAHILSAFRIEPANEGPAAEIEAFEDFLFDQMNRGRRVLLIVDEAQNLPRETLEELRVLSNLDYDGTPLFQVFLIGQPDFRPIIAADGMEQLRQRIIASYHLEPLSLDDVRAYVEHRLSVVGWNGDPAIEPAAFERVHEATAGLPRRINKLFNRILLYCQLEGLHAVTEDVVRAVVEDMSEENMTLSDAASAAPHANGRATDVEGLDMPVGAPPSADAAPAIETVAATVAATGESVGGSAGEPAAGPERNTSENASEKVSLRLVSNEGREADPFSFDDLEDGPPVSDGRGAAMDEPADEADAGLADAETGSAATSTDYEPAPESQGAEDPGVAAAAADDVSDGVDSHVNDDVDNSSADVAGPRGVAGVFAALGFTGGKRKESDAAPAKVEASSGETVEKVVEDDARVATGEEIPDHGSPVAAGAAASNSEAAMSEPAPIASDGPVSVLDRLRARKAGAGGGRRTATLHDVASAIEAESGRAAEAADDPAPDVDAMLEPEAPTDAGAEETLAALSETVTGDKAQMSKRWREALGRTMTATQADLQTAHDQISRLRRKIADAEQTRRKSEEEITERLDRAEGILTELRDAWR